MVEKKKMRVSKEFADLQKRSGMTGPVFTKFMAEMNRDLPERLRTRKRRRGKLVIEI